MLKHIRYFVPAVLIALAIGLVDSFTQTSRWTLIIASTVGTATAYLVLDQQQRRSRK